MYNYGLCLKPGRDNKFGLSINYLTVYPALSADFLYKFNKSLDVFVSVSKNWHPMASMGAGSSELKSVF